jgi:hypothetical protein
MPPQQFSKDDLTSISHLDDTAAQAQSKLLALRDVLADSPTSSSGRLNIDNELVDDVADYRQYMNTPWGDSRMVSDEEKAVIWALETKAKAAAGVVTASSGTMTPLQIQQYKLNQGTWKPTDGYYFETSNGVAYDPTGEARTKLDEIKRTATSWEWLRDNGYDYTEGGTVYGTKVSGPKGGYNTGWETDPAKQGDYQKKLEAFYGEYKQPSAGFSIDPASIPTDLDRAEKILFQAGLDDSEQRKLIDSFIKIEKGESHSSSLLAPDQPLVAATGQGTAVDEDTPLASDATSSSNPQQFSKDDLTSISHLDDTAAQAQSKLLALRDVLADSPTSSSGRLNIDNELVDDVADYRQYMNTPWGDSRMVSDEEKAVIWALETKANYAGGKTPLVMTPQLNIAMQDQKMENGTYTDHQGYRFISNGKVLWDTTGVPFPPNMGPRTGNDPYGGLTKTGDFVNNPGVVTGSWEWLRDNGYSYIEGGVLANPLNPKTVSGPKGEFSKPWVGPNGDPSLKSDRQKLIEQAGENASGVVNMSTAFKTGSIPTDLDRAEKILFQAGLDDSEQRKLIDSFIKIEKGESHSSSLLAPDQPLVAATGQGTAVDEDTPLASDATSSSNPQQFTRDDLTSLSNSSGVNNETLATPVVTSTRPTESNAPLASSDFVADTSQVKENIHNDRASEAQAQQDERQADGLAKATAAQTEADEKKQQALAIATSNKQSSKEDRLRKITEMRKPYMGGAASSSSGSDALVVPPITPASQIPPSPF